MTLVDLPGGFNRHRDPMALAMAKVTNPQATWSVFREEADGRH